MIVNLTQHKASVDQVAAGVVDLDDSNNLKQLLNFETCPAADDIRQRAAAITELAVKAGAKQVMIGGALWLMAPLINELNKHGIEAVFAFSIRDTAETTLPDGRLVKTTVFKHAGFVPAII